MVTIGGGFIGLEAAASAASRGASVTVVEAGPRPLTRACPAPMAELIKAKHERSGVRIATGAMVERIDVNKGRSEVVLAGGCVHLADLVVVGVGVVPNVELAQAAGLAVDDGIMLDETLATSVQTFSMRATAVRSRIASTAGGSGWRLGATRSDRGRRPQPTYWARTAPTRTCHGSGRSI